MSAKILSFPKKFSRIKSAGDSKTGLPNDLFEMWPFVVNTEQRNSIVEKFQPLVKYTASQLIVRLPSHVLIDDLISAGNIGLFNAIAKFDPRKNIEFKTYAEFRIKGAILDELRSLDWIPRSVRKKQHLLEKTYEKLQKSLGRPAEPEEVAKALGIDMKELHELLDITKPLSLLDIDGFWKVLPDDKSDSDNDKVFEAASDRDNENPFQALNISQLQNIVTQSMKDFPYGMQLLISLYFYEELTMGEISLLAGCTESRISQLLIKALREIKSELAKRLGISDYTSAIYTDRHRERPFKKSLISFPKTLIWNPEKPGDDDPREKGAPYRWKNFARKISKKISSLHAEKKGEGKMKERKPGRTPGITTFISYRTVLRLRELGITKTDDMLALTSEQFVQKCSGLNPRSIRAVAVNMIINDLNFQDGREATRCLENYNPKTYPPFVKTPAAAPSPQTPSREAGVDPLVIRPAVSEASPDVPVSKNSLRATLLRFSAAFDFLTVNGGSPDKIEGYQEGFMAENEQEYLLLISITRKNPPA